MITSQKALKILIENSNEFKNLSNKVGLNFMKMVIEAYFERCGKVDAKLEDFFTHDELSASAFKVLEEISESMNKVIIHVMMQEKHEGLPN